MLRWIPVLVFLTIMAFSVTGTPDNEFQKWLKQHKKEFKSFVDEHDKEFASFLKNNWVETSVIPEQQRDSVPKPTDIPSLRQTPDEVQDDDPIVTLPVKPLPLPAPDKPAPVIEPELTFPTPKKNKMTLSFLDRKLNLPELSYAKLNIRSVNKDSIADSWLAMAKSEFSPVVDSLKQSGEELALDDWGQALLTHEYLIKNNRFSFNELQLYTWFYLVKQGYDARVSYNEGKVYLMMQVKQTLFGQKYFNLKEGKYYFVDLAKKKPIKVESVYTYNKQHASATAQLNIDLRVAPKHGKSDSKRALSTKINKKRVGVTTPYNSAYIEYLDRYPQLNMENYFRAELPSETKQALLTQLVPYLEGLSETQALNLLLHFVQNSLSYQTDQQQFSYENYLFAGETLHYPYADCEDRAVFYAYLVKNLLGKDVVGLQYDGHIATAVAVQSKVAGDTFQINGKSYVVADPTFINAKIGQTMRGFENQKPKFIVY